jgi:hypothetical protein
MSSFIFYLFLEFRGIFSEQFRGVLLSFAAFFM